MESALLPFNRSSATAFDIHEDGALADRRTWADLGERVPDGICLDAEGALWYADVPNKRCVRMRGVAKNCNQSM
jgi:sugar lactone lactonase YvrE